MRWPTLRISRRAWTRVVLCGASALALWLALRQADWSGALRLVRSAPGLLWVGPLYALALGWDALGLQLLLQRCRARVGLGGLFGVRIASEATILSLPSGGVLAEAVSLVLLRERCGTPTAPALASLAGRKLLLAVSHGAAIGLGALLGWESLRRASAARPIPLGLHWLTVLVGITLLGGGLLLARLLIAPGSGLRRRLGALRIPRLRSWLERRRASLQVFDRHLAQALAPSRETALASGAFFLLWLTEAAETWLTLRLLGAELDFGTILPFEALLSLARGLAFFVPAGLGIQDLGYAAVLQALGIPHAATLALAFILVKRVKEALFAAAGYLLLLGGGAASATRAGAGRPALERRGTQGMRPLRKSVLFICGSLNQTTQMHQIARQLPEYAHAFTPYYCDGLLELARQAGGLEFTILGYKLRARCLDYIERQGLPLDERGARGDYELVITCSDLIVPRNVRGRPLVVVQEGILDPAGLGFRLYRRWPFLPLWLGGTSTTGLSGAYTRFCVASEGYRELFIANGAAADRVVVTGIPNFDDCRRFLRNEFPHRGYVLVCSSDARETFKRDDRRAFVEHCLWIARGRTLIFKLHPNENAERASGELKRWAPNALVYASGSAEEMIANCDVLITQYSSTAFVGMALGKEVHSYFSQEELQRLLPVQNACAARNIADVCRDVLEAPERVPDAAPELAVRTAVAR